MECVLQPFQPLDRALVAHIAGVQRRRRLEQHHFDFLIRHRPMLDAARDNDEFARRNVHGAIPEFHPEAPPDHIKQLVLEVVVVPHEGPEEFDQLHHLPVQLAHHLGRPPLGKRRQLRGAIDHPHLVHPQAPSRRRRARPSRATRSSVPARRSRTTTCPLRRSSGPITTARAAPRAAANSSCLRTACSRRPYSIATPCSRSSWASRRTGATSSPPTATRKASSGRTVAGGTFRSLSSSPSTTSPIPNPRAGKSTPPSAFNNPS